jgi:hypothetical protein
MFTFPWFWVFFGMFFWVFLLRPRRLWACQRSSTDEMREPFEPRHRRRGRADLESALAQRDAMIAQLEERVRVLERIATDRSARLREEIEGLRDTPPPERS